MSRIAIIGGGAAGLACSLFSLRNGHDVTLFEKNSLLGKKLGITGKGRCNVTNYCSKEDFLKNVPTNPEFLFSAISKFDSYDTMNLFEELGVPLKVERGNRVFPKSDKAVDIVLALKNEIVNNGIHLKTENVIDIIAEENKITRIKTNKGIYSNFDDIVIATGGLSYQLTGSTGDGYKFAKKIGHTIIDPKPSLIALESNNPICKKTQGLNLKNVTAKLYDNKKDDVVFEELGEMLFTHFGLSGPIILSASSHMKTFEKDRYSINVDLKPALSNEQLDKRILSDFNKYSNKNLSNALVDLLPSKLILPFIEYCKLSPELKVNSITKEERKLIVDYLKCIKIDISGPRPINEAIITSGGVSTKEINPSNMRSKICNNLYFCGEVIDVDAYTGGFNLQIAFSTAYVVANSIK